MQLFYESCMNTRYIDNDRDVHVRDEIRRLGKTLPHHFVFFCPMLRLVYFIGGWAIRNEWSFETFDHRLLLRQLHARFNVEPFFSIRTVPDEWQLHKTAIKIFPAELGLPSKKFYELSPDHQVS